MFSQGSDEALPVTGRRAKRENGGLGEDPPGSTITRQQVLRTWKFRKWKAGAKRANVRCPGSLFEGQKRLARGQKIFDCQFSEPVLFPYPTSYAFSGGSGQSRFASLSSGVFFPRERGWGETPKPFRARFARLLRTPRHVLVGVGDNVDSMDEFPVGEEKIRNSGNYSTSILLPARKKSIRRPERSEPRGDLGGLGDSPW